jgi:hypothetical protein
MFWKRVKRVLWSLGLVMMVVGALFGIPIIIDPPPRDCAAESQDQFGARPRRKRRRRA